TADRTAEWLTSVWPGYKVHPSGTCTALQRASVAQKAFHSLRQTTRLIQMDHVPAFINAHALQRLYPFQARFEFFTRIAFGAKQGLLRLASFYPKHPGFYSFPGGKNL